MPLIDERAARWAARLAVPATSSDQVRVAALQRAVHDDLPAVDRAAREFTGLGTGLGPTRVRVIGRFGWVRANLAALRGGLEPLAERLEGPRVVASRLLGLQIGALFGLLSRRVLGQFILPLGGPGGGQLVVVGPNVLGLAEEHGDLARDIRRAVLLHEVTHRLQFDGVPWLGDHLRGLLEAYLEGARVDVSALTDVVSRLPEAVARAIETGELTPVLESVLTPEQVEVIGRAQGLMSLLEGHGNTVMFEGADGLVGDVETVRATLTRRRTDLTARVLGSVAGMDMKRRQYREGEAFVRAVIDRGGVDALNRAFEGPGQLPGRDEITDPDAWMRRVDPAAGDAG